MCPLERVDQVVQQGNACHSPNLDGVQQYVSDG